MDGSMVDSIKEDQWTVSIVDPQLRRTLEKGDFNNTDDLIRTAFILLERRIRESTGLSGHQFGKELIDTAFHPDTGLLQPVSPVGAERAGLHHLLLGIFLYYRNPIAHRPVYHSPKSSQHVFSLIDHALGLIRNAAEHVIDLNDFVGAHEGQILRRRDYRLDIDQDGEEEIVILVDLGPSMDEGKAVPHLASIILKKNEKGYSRIPAEWIRGQSIYGPLQVKNRYVTDKQRPDLVVHWAWGETMELVVVLRHRDDKYVLALRDIPAGMEEPYSGPHMIGFGVHGRQGFHFADVDGDGLAEMIHVLFFDPEDLEKMGYSNLAKDGEAVDVCRLWKWDTQTERIVQMEERAIVRKFNRSGYE